jgi:hypothetical protein
VKDLLSNVGSGGGAPVAAGGAPAAAGGGAAAEAPKEEEKKEEEKEESDDDMVRQYALPIIPFLNACASPLYRALVSSIKRFVGSLLSLSHTCFRCCIFLFSARVVFSISTRNPKKQPKRTARCARPCIHTIKAIAPPCA